MQPQNQENTAGWSYKTDESQGPQPENNEPQVQASVDPISWTGSEFLDRHKDSSWYFLLALAIVVICGFVYLVSKDYLSVIFIAVMGFLFAIVASRKPKQLQYVITSQGIKIGSKDYKFGDFKSFSLQRDGAIGYINLLPLKRIATELSIYYAPQDEQRIYDAISQHIPHEQVRESLIDRAFKAFHF